MKLDYFTLLCPEPISLSIGKIRQPTLREIGKLTFRKFGMYQVYLKLTPKDYYLFLNNERRENFWEMLTDEQKDNITLFDVIILEDELTYEFLDMFNFFFVERVIIRDNVFLIVNTDDYDTPSDELELGKHNIVGIITPTNLVDILDVIQQVCCIKSVDPLDEPQPKFKNEKAKRLYERMLKAREEQKIRKSIENYIDMTLPNLISSVAAKDSGLNIINIWDATLFQLYDQFGKIQNDDIHYLNVVRVAVWGDEKNKFDHSFWYKNNYDKKIINEF